MGYLASSVDSPIERILATAAEAGRMYAVSTGPFAVTSGGTRAAISLFWTARNSKIIVISAKVQNISSFLSHQLNRTTTDPNYSGHLITGLAISPALVGQANSTAALTSTTEAASTATGTLHRAGYMQTTQPVAVEDLLPKPTDYLVIPANVAGGVLLLINGVNTATCAGEIIWVEI